MESCGSSRAPSTPGRGGRAAGCAPGRDCATVRPELPAAYQPGRACRTLIGAVLERAGAHGVVALRGTAVAGYLAGIPATEPIWGRACWSPIEGSALAADIEPERVSDLYAAWAEHFVRVATSASTSTPRSTTRP